MSSVIQNKTAMMAAKKKKKNNGREPWDKLVPNADGTGEVWLSDTFENPEELKKDLAFQDRARSAHQAALDQDRARRENAKINEINPGQTPTPTPTPSPGQTPAQAPAQPGMSPREAQQGYRNGPTAALSTGLDYARSPAEVMARLREGRVSMSLAKNGTPEQMQARGAAAVAAKKQEQAANSQQAAIGQANAKAGATGTGFFTQDRSGALTRVNSNRSLMDGVRKKKKGPA